MKAARTLLTLTLVLGFACLVVYASGTTKAEMEKMKTYPPGSTTAFRWVSVEEGVSKIETLKMPGMIYYYNCNDRPKAFMWEVKLFDCPGMKGLKDKLIIMRCDSTDKLDKDKTKGIRIPKGKTGVLFVDSTGRKIKSLSRPVSPSMFHRVIHDVVKKNRDVVKEAKEKAKEKAKQE